MKKPLPDPMPSKSGLRPLLRSCRREAAAGEEGEARSLALQERLLNSPLWQGCRRVVLYVSVKGEAGTARLLEDAWRTGREVFLPRCRTEGGAMAAGEMDMIACRGPEGLEVSRFGIPEPPLGPCSRLLTDAELMAGEETLVVVPALAFDRQGFRLGYGGGYYDRLLARAACATVGLAFHDLLFDALPRDRWDQPVQAVCTEEELLCIRP